MNKKRSLLFYQYLLSYFLIFLVPFAIMSIGFYSISTSNVRNAITSSNVGKLEQGMDFLDERLAELRNLAIRVSLDDKLTPYKLSQPYSGREGFYQLMNYQSSNSLIDTLVLTFYDTPILHTSRGTTSIENLVKNIYSMAEEEISLFIDDLHSITAPALKTITLRTEGDKRSTVLAYICPIPPQSPYSSGAVIYFIEESKLRDMIASSLGTLEGITYIYHKESEAVLTSTVPVSQEVIQWSEAKLDDDSNILNADFAGENYTVVMTHSQENNLAIVSLMPTKQFYKEMTMLKRTIYIILSLTVVVGVAVMVILTKRQYGPIEQLIKAVNLKLGKGNVRKSKDLDSIRETIESVFEDKEELERRIIMQRSYVFDQYLIRLLRGSALEEYSLQELLPGIDLERRGDYFFVVKIVFTERVSEESLEQREQALLVLERVANRDCIAHGVELFNENAVALIVNTIEPSEAIRKEFILDLAGGLANQLKLATTIGVGRIYGSINQINHSFVEASAAIEHNLVTDRNVIFFEDITNTASVGEWYSFEHKLQLSQAIKEGNVKVAVDSLGIIMQELWEKKPSMPLLKFMYYDLINVVLKVNSELGMLANSDEISQLVEFNSSEEFQEQLLHLIELICERKDIEKAKQDEQINDDIINFIRAHFTDNNLSLTLIADKFGLSASYLSRLIKEKVGETFTQYVWNLRVTKFKGDLLTDGDTIGELVKKIGYVDVANFTRKFRETEGMTPGQYRKKHSDKN